MATYYVLAGSPNSVGQIQIPVVVRVTVPAGNNTVGTAWSVAVAEYRIDAGLAGTSLWPGNTAVPLDNGSEWEFKFNHKTNVNRPDVEAKLEADVAAQATEEQTRMADLLRYWGKTGTV